VLGCSPCRTHALSQNHEVGPLRERPCFGRRERKNFEDWKKAFFPCNSLKSHETAKEKLGKSKEKLGESNEKFGESKEIVGKSLDAFERL
jgi:hypothetical protein